MFFFDLTPPVVLGDELITNGSFTGNASGWSLGANWTYGSDRLNFTNSNGIIGVAKPSSGILNAPVMVSGNRYRVSFTTFGTEANLGAPLGFIVASLDDGISNGPTGTSIVFAADAGNVTFDGVLNSVGDRIIFTPSPDFNGWIDNVSIKEIL